MNPPSLIGNQGMALPQFTNDHLGPVNENGLRPINTSGQDFALNWIKNQGTSTPDQRSAGGQKSNSWEGNFIGAGGLSGNGGMDSAGLIGTVLGGLL